MKKYYTEIAFVLDRSGSMGVCQHAAIEGFNRFLREQQEVEGIAKLTLILFDDEYEVLTQSLPVHEVTRLDERTYQPRGRTALLDAVGRSIDELGQRLAKIPENDRPGQVIVAILTDGLENASQQFTWKDVSDRIKHQTKVYKWTFLFLGANQDAIATAAQISIGAANAATYMADKVGARSSQSSLSRKAMALRKRSMGTATREDLADAEAPMQALVEEEDRKERGGE